MIPGSDLLSGMEIEKRVMAPIMGRLPEEVVNAPINRVFPGISSVANIIGGKIGVPKLASTSFPITRTAGEYGINKIANLFKEYRNSLPKGR